MKNIIILFLTTVFFTATIYTSELIQFNYNDFSSSDESSFGGGISEFDLFKDYIDEENNKVAFYYSSNELISGHDLNPFGQYRFAQINCPKQIGDSCAKHAAANLLAFQNCENNKRITLEKLLINSRIYFSSLCQNEEKQEQLYMEEVINILLEQRQGQFTILQYDQSDKSITIFANKNKNKDEVTTHETNFEKLFEQNQNILESLSAIIKNNKNAHFLCCSGHHWTYFVTTKHFDKKPALIHMNSRGEGKYFNDPVANNCHEYKFTDTLLDAMALSNI